MAAAIVFVVSTCIQAQKVTVDVDRATDFSSIRTFGWTEGQVARNPHVAHIIMSAIEGELTARGLSRNDSAPDIKIMVMAAVGIDLQGVGPSWNNAEYRSWGGYGNPNALMNVSAGTLLVDLLKTPNNSSVWRGVAKKTLVGSPMDDPAKAAADNEKEIRNAVKKLFKKYPVSGVAK
jgi:hypothetical protein